MKDKTPLLINIWGAPGVGKSQSAAVVYYHLKSWGVKAELLREHIKLEVWRGRDPKDKSVSVPCYVSQTNELIDLLRAVDCVVTDAPLYLYHFYNEIQGVTDYHPLTSYSLPEHDEVDVLLRPGAPYHREGRVETESESRRIATILPRYIEARLGKKLYVCDNPLQVVELCKTFVSERGLGKNADSV